MLNKTLTGKITALEKLLAGLEEVLVALSGGVDSAVLLKLAADCLGPGRVRAVTFLSETAAGEEMALAARLAQLCQVSHQFIPVDELALPEYAANPENRCYHCQRHRFQRLLETMAPEKPVTVLNGAHQSDQGDYRPGQQALRELGVRSPLKECGFTKKDLRLLAKEFGLPNWNRPSDACLASRLPYGIPVTKTALGQIRAGENLLRTAGFTQCRLRHHGVLARLEVPPEEFPRFLDSQLLAELLGALKKLGYIYVALDLHGYRTGSLNETRKT